MVRIAAQHIADAAPAGTLGDTGNALREERVVAQVGMRVERHRREENHNRLLEGIGGLDCYVERGIVESALCSLHPVDDAAAGRRWSGAANGDARIGGEIVEAEHDE